jgi:membrane protein
MQRSIWMVPFAAACGALLGALTRRPHSAVGRRELSVPVTRLAESAVLTGAIGGLAVPLVRDRRARAAVDREAARLRRAERRAARAPVVAPAGTQPGRIGRAFAVAKAAASGWFEDGCIRLGASVAFYTIFALAPFLVVTLLIASAVFGEEAASGQVFAQLQGLVGADAAENLQQMLAAANEQQDEGGVHAIWSIVLALIGASGVFIELKNAFDTIWKPLPGSTSSSIGVFVRARLTAVALVLGIGFLVVASLVLSAALAGLGKWLGGALGIGAPVMAVIDVVVSTSALTVAFFALIRWLPQKAPGTRATWIGAFTSALLFAIGKHFIGLYLAREGVASAYGAAGSFVVVILWVYYSAQILLFGAEVTRALEPARGDVANPPATAPRERVNRTPPTPTRRPALVGTPAGGAGAGLAGTPASRAAIRSGAGS